MPTESTYNYRVVRQFAIMLLISVALMTAAMLATALLPTYSQIGAVAGWLLFLLRCVMGFSVGGEYTGVVAYLLEGAPQNRRGLIASLASAASEIGALLAVGISATTVALMDEASLQSWGWRIPVLFGALLAATVWIARSTMTRNLESDFGGTVELNFHPTGVVLTLSAPH